jgi:hypothetical protein
MCQPGAIRRFHDMGAAFVKYFIIAFFRARGLGSGS